MTSSLYPNLASTHDISWATTRVNRKWLNLVIKLCRHWPGELTETFLHWSRNYEYQWILENGNFQQGQHVLDAGGAGCPLQYILLTMGLSVMNVDKEVQLILPMDSPHHLIIEGNLEALSINDNYFDQVVCASVLEHTDLPAQILRELWRVLKPGGRLLVTLDVAEPTTPTIRLNEQAVEELIQPLGLVLPMKPDDLLEHDLGGETQLKVLCFYCDKQPA